MKLKHTTKHTQHRLISFNIFSIIFIIYNLLIS